MTRRSSSTILNRVLLSLLLSSGVFLPFPAPACAQEAYGFTEPYLMIDIAAPEAGLVTALAVKEGDEVQEGTLLAVLDSDVLAAALEIAKARAEAKGGVESATAELQLRRTRLEKLEQVRQQEGASQAEVDRARADVAVAEAQLLREQEQRRVHQLEAEHIEAQINRRRIVCPVDGTVTELFKHRSEFVSTERPEILTVVQIDRLRIQFQVPANQAQRLQRGDAVKLRSADQTKVFDAEIASINPLRDGQSGTVAVNVVLKNPDRKYSTGLRFALVLNETTPPGISKAATQRRATRTQASPLRIPRAAK